jgi:lipoprotein-anchoring transpeptidase ErfK/SrfK
MRRICMSALRSVFLASVSQFSLQNLPASADPLQLTFSPYVTSQPAQPAYVVQTAQPVNQQYAGQQYYVDAPPPGYAPVAPRYAPPVSPPQPAASFNPGGGGFLEAIFGGPTIQAHVYQPAQPEYQAAPAPAPQVATVNPMQPYAPPTQGDMSAYPIDPQFLPQVVDYRGDEAPGTIIVDTPDKFLFLIEEGGKALRYGIGVGRPGFTWAGVKTITAKREWPDWRPPADMLARRPDLPRFMAGGIDNPLGARALYLGSTLYRIHGSNEPWTIGTDVSSGCIRMRN